MKRVPAGGKLGGWLENQQIEKRGGKPVVRFGGVKLRQGEGQLCGKAGRALLGEGTEGGLFGGEGDAGAFELREPDGFGRGGLGKLGVGEAREHEAQNGGFGGQEHPAGVGLKLAQGFLCDPLEGGVEGVEQDPVYEADGGWGFRAGEGTGGG